MIKSIFVLIIFKKNKDVLCECREKHQQTKVVENLIPDSDNLMDFKFKHLFSYHSLKTQAINGMYMKIAGD